MGPLAKSRKPPDQLHRFVALFDLHWGYERVNGKTRPLHDPKAIDIALQFIGDFRPHTVILGGDILDCGAISHHNDRKPGRVEGLRLFSDATELRKDVLSVIETQNRNAALVYITGNHEDWLNDLVDQNPGLDGLVDLRRLLHLGDRWRLIPQGGAYQLGKLWFIHGDQLRGGEMCAKAAVLQWERNVRFGHHHTYQAYTKIAPADAWGHTGVSVPCLCSKAPKYGEGGANRWIQGFNYGWVGPRGLFQDRVALIVNNQCMAEGTLYQG